MKTFQTVLTLMFIPLLGAHAQVVWDGGGTGNDWSTGDNWDTDTVPTSSDVAEGPGSGSAAIDITTAAEASYFSNQNGAGDTLTLNINTGGSLTESSNTFGARFANGSNTIINIAGGTLDGGEDVYGPDAGNSGSVTYNVTDGLLTGYDRFRYSNATVNVSGGTLDMAGQSVFGNLSFANNAALTLSGTGTMVFDIDGNNSSDQLNGSNAVDLTGGVIGFRFASTYTPQVGDSFDFLNVGITVDETGSNIATTDVDGLYNITWDTSNWAVGSGIGNSKGELTIDAISVIPEPSSVLLMLGAFAALGIGVDRRR